jgi:hypothetical protein
MLLPAHATENVGAASAHVGVGNGVGASHRTWRGLIEHADVHITVGEIDGRARAGTNDTDEDRCAIGAAEKTVLDGIHFNDTIRRVVGDPQKRGATQRASGGGSRHGHTGDQGESGSKVFETHG